MNYAPKINNIQKVFDGVLKIGILNKKSYGRHSDAFVYFKSGTVKYTFDSYTITAKAGNILFLPIDSIYTMQIEEEAYYICVDFNFDKNDNVRKAEIYKNTPGAIGNDFEKLFYNWYRGEAWYMINAFSYIYRIYTTILKTRYKNYSKSGKHADDAVKYILEHYTTSTLEISEIAEAVGISQTHLRRILKNKLNMSPVQYISFLRIEKAKSLLKDSNCTVTEVSLLCGFSDQFYFSREFKSKVGISPSEYRKN